MKRTRMSELRPWAIQWQFTTRVFAALVLLCWPLIILWCVLHGCLKAVGRELKNAWDDRREVAEIRRYLTATAFKKWENDL